MMRYSVRWFEVEDRAVVSLNANRALVFDGKQWRLTGIPFARKTLVDGKELSWAEFRLVFPRATQLLPRTLLQSILAISPV